MSLRLSQDHKWESIPCYEAHARVAVCQYEWILETVNSEQVNGMFNIVLFIACFDLIDPLLREHPEDLPFEKDRIHNCFSKLTLAD